MAFNPNNFTPRLIAVDDAMSLTRANITGWGKADIEAMFFKETGLDRLIAQAKEARMAGARQRTLTDLLLSRCRPGKNAAMQSVIQPFRFQPRRNRINPGYFRISAGVQADIATHYGSNAPAANIGAHWALTVNNGSLDADSSKFMQAPNNVLQNIEKYFLPGHNVTLEWKDQATGVAKTAQMRIISSKNVDANQCYVVVAPNRSYQGDTAYGMAANGRTAATPGWWETAVAADKAGYQPTSGVLTIGTNSVSDFQSYGSVLPGVNDYGLVEYWRQTYRWVHKYNDQYKAALDAATTSEGLAKFRMLPLAQLRAQQEKMHEDFFWNTVFFGDVLNEHQTTADWQNLPQVLDPAWSGSGESGSLPIEYLSNTLGFRTQLAQAGVVLDKQGGRLDVDDLLEALWWVKREREAESGQSVSEIDLMCDMRWTRPTLRTLFVRYFKAKYGLDNVQAFMQIGQKISFEGTVMWEYDSYDLPDFGITLKVISDVFFDDRIAQFDTNNKSRGRGLWVLDWSDLAVNIIKTRSVTRTNNLADNVYKYVIDQNVQHVLLNSKTFEVAVGNTNRHRIIENFSDATPKLTVPGVDINS
jgi:hypothetical protein